jgi:acyl-coenzyme A synthetase/AMP-(fatty) acid ligase
VRVVGLAALSTPASALSSRENRPDWTTSRAETDPAFILPTSGSTGAPKGVVLSHLNALAFARWAAEAVGLGPGDTVLNVAPFHFDLSVFDIYASLLRGARLVLAPPHAAKFPGELLGAIETHRVTVLYTVPTVLRLLVDAGAFADGAGRSLRTIMYAGEPFPVPALRRLMAALPHVTVHNFFGPTETNVCLAERLASAPASDDAEVPIGVPASGAHIMLVDEQGLPVSEGEIGEIQVDGPTVMLGYQTREGFAPAARPFRTGDFALRGPSGSLLFRGRRDDMVKVRGQRIELKAVEHVLQGVTGVAEVAALAVDDQLVALVAARPGVEEAALRSACRAKLPPGSMPHRFLLVEEFPRLSNGKLDRRRLAVAAAADVRSAR